MKLEGRKELLGLWLGENEGAKFWLGVMTDIIAIFDFPPPSRKAIYTTNAIESVNSVIRKFTRNRKIYPNDAIPLAKEKMLDLNCQAVA